MVTILALSISSTELGFISLSASTTFRNCSPFFHVF